MGKDKIPRRDKREEDQKRAGIEQHDGIAAKGKPI
jgi:hypothetical protein